MPQRKSGVVVLGPPPSEAFEETIQIIIPPKPGEENQYEAGLTMKTMDVCSLSISNIGQETDLPSSKLPFTLKLFEMLEHVARSGQEDIVSWVDGGRGFKVHDLDKFVEDIIPNYFKQTKYKSFQRQLYFYGFQRKGKGAGTGSYFHPYFRRDRKTLCLSMSPKKAGSGNNSPAKVAHSREIRTSPPPEPSHDPTLAMPEEGDTRRVSVESLFESALGEDVDQADWRDKMTNVIMKTSTPSLFAAVPPARVSLVEEEQYPGFHPSSGGSGSNRNDGFIERRQQAPLYWQQEQPLQQLFFAHEGDTLCVFDDMTFHYVEHAA